LNMQQHYQLIFAHLPLRHPIRTWLGTNSSENLAGLLSHISTLSSQVHSRYNLEKMISLWRLDNKDEKSMYLSIANLYDLLDRSREDFSERPANCYKMYMEIIAIIQRQEGLPKFIQENLHEVRLKISEKDKPVHMTQMLVAACHKFIGVRVRGHSQVKNITVPVHGEQQEDDDDGGQDENEDQEDEYGYQEDDSDQEYDDSHDNDDDDGDQDDDPDGQYDDDDESKQGEDSDGSGEDSDQDSEETVRRSPFVKPWPRDRRYKSRRGAFKDDFMSHFSGYCNRCGHNSHQSPYCWIYRVDCDVLCQICLQGLHMECKSRRRDIQQERKITQLMDDQLGELRKEVEKLKLQLSQTQQPPNPDATVPSSTNNQM